MVLVAGCICWCSPSDAQTPTIEDRQDGERVSVELREVYRRGIEFLTKRQADSGDFPDDDYHGPGVTGLFALTLLASGEDPNYGPHRDPIRKSLRYILRAQNSKTGYFGFSMYHHAFATLTIAEAYGTVDDRRLWEKIPAKEIEAIADSEYDTQHPRQLAQALRLAVQCSVTARKKNPKGAWRYSPEAVDADTSVTGAVLISLLAARNAGIEVPDACIDGGLQYLQQMTGPDGDVGYTGSSGGGGDSRARSAIASLVFSIAKRRDLPQYESSTRFLEQTALGESRSWREYGRYYTSQALFQADPKKWRAWRDRLMEQLQGSQKDTGELPGQMGPISSTSLNLLSIAVTFRLLPIYER